MDKYSREYFVAQGKKGGDSTKKKYGKDYYKEIRKKRGSLIHNKGVDVETEEE